MFIPILLLILSIVLTVTKSSLYNLFGKRTELNAGNVFAYNTVTFLVGLAVIFLCDPRVTVGKTTVLCALAYALDVFLLQSLSVLSMKLGSMSLTSTLVLYGMVLPALAGPIFFGEKFGACAVAGLVLMLVSIAFFIEKEKKEKGERISRKAAALAVLCFFLSGGAGILEKVHQSSEGREERSGFLLVAYGIMFLFSFVGYLSTAQSGKRLSAIRSALLLGGASGIVLGFCCRINLTLAGTLNSLLYYPVANGGALLLTLVISVLFFGETFSLRRKIGFTLGLLSIIALSLPY